MTVIEHIRAEFTEENQAQLRVLVKAKLTPIEIAETMDKPLPTITSWCDRLGLDPRKMTREEINARFRERQKAPKLAKIEPRERVPLKRNPTQEAQACFGDRMTEKNGQYHLDGRPIGYDPLIQATNDILKANGLPQLDANPAWVRT